MKHLLLLVFTILFANISQAQFPPLEISADHVQATAPGLVEVPIRAGNNWQNITAVNGTFTFDTTVISWDQVSFWGLSNPNGATFTYQGGGVLTFTWQSLITIGPTLSNGSIAFTLRFNAVGSGGQTSPVHFSSSPQAIFWTNGFGWSGSNFAASDGSVTIFCATPDVGFSTVNTGGTVCFTDTTSGSPTQWLWDFGDGNTSTQQNPCHTYASTGNYTACLTATDSCGTDSACQTITICGAPATS